MLGVLTLACLVGTFVSRPPYTRIRITSIILFVLVALQGGLGFASFSGNDALIIIHLANAVLVLIVAAIGSYFSVRWNKMASMPSKATSETKPPM